MAGVLAQCKRCGAFTLLDDGVVKIAVDITPLDGSGYLAAVMGGVELHWAEKRQNGAWKLFGRHGGGLVSFEPATGRQNGPQRLHRAHACGAGQSKAVKPAPGPPTAPATADPHAPGGQGQPSSPAGSATHHLSKGVRCHICRKLIDQTKPFTGIFCERWIWAVHEEC